MGKIIVFDLMETILSGGGIYPVVKREGLDQFLKKYSDCLFVIATDIGSLITKEEDIEEVERYLRELGIKDRIVKIYYGWDMNDEFKDLRKIAADFNVNLENLVFIGDGDRDEKSAKHFGVKFIKVPAIFRDVEKVRSPTRPETYLEDYQKAPDKFSFANLTI